MFLSELYVKKVSNTKYLYELTEELYWEGNNDVIAVPKGFRTDFASIPSWLRWMFPPMGTLTDRPAVLHDWLYCTKQFTKQESDKIFLKAMEEVGVSYWKRKMFYSAVKYFGGSSWRKAVKDDNV